MQGSKGGSLSFGIKVSKTNIFICQRIFCVWSGQRKGSQNQLLLKLTQPKTVSILCPIQYLRLLWFLILIVRGFIRGHNFLSKKGVCWFSLLIISFLRIFFPQATSIMTSPSGLNFPYSFNNHNWFWIGGRRIVQADYILVIWFCQ